MNIGIPLEIKPFEKRVALLPAAVAELTAMGHTVFLQSAAGAGSGYDDMAYTAAGAKIVADAESLYAESVLIVKVKEPVTAEYAYLREDHRIFSFLHLAANPELANQLQKTGLTAIAFETLMVDNSLPLLAPMSDVAGRISVQAGANYLFSHHGGKGLLLGGLPAAERGNVVIIGAGNAGGSAAVVARGLGALVTVFDLNRHKQAKMREIGDNVSGLYPYPDAVAAAIEGADLVVGAVLIPGARAPHVVTADMVKSMQSGSVIVDIAVDQGGCVETTRPTDYSAPTYMKDEVVHFAVTNMPAAVPRSASQALSAGLLPYVKLLLNEGVTKDSIIYSGVNVEKGRIVHPVVARSLRN
ncbi:MAG: alanine dehydrogenase [Gammaproteobacteria bacterium]|nr:alanine dehydrogenase [Gammaproteobacteria bacterium]MDX2487635.1 alanine dehydrogenase [Gammaproteobacteria bacterium]